MLPLVLGITCFIWLLSAVVLLVVGIYRSKSQPDDKIERYVHDGSGLIAGMIVAILLGPIGIIFWAIDKWRESD